MDFSEIKSFINGEGKLTQFPSKRGKQLICIAYIAQKLTKSAEYTEKEFNELLNGLHTFGDPCLLRRELLNAGYVSRTPDGKKYTVIKTEETEA